MKPDKWVVFDGASVQIVSAKTREKARERVESGYGVRCHVHLLDMPSYCCRLSEVTEYSGVGVGIWW